MIQKIIFSSLMVALLTSPIKAHEEVQVPMDFESSFSLFKDICIKPLPFSEDFFDAINASSIKWKKNRKERGSRLGKGDSYSADEGLLSYQFLPNSAFSVTDPACDFEFTVADDFDHELARQEISTYLILESKNTSNKDAREACWQGELDDGRNIRFRLSSGFESDGQNKARLSIGYIKKFPLNLENKLRRSGALRCK